MVFIDQPLAQSFGIEILVLIPKVVPEQYQGIALLEVLFKLVFAIIKQRILKEIKYHQAVHGFRKGFELELQSFSYNTNAISQRTTNPLYLYFWISRKHLTLWAEPKTYRF
jgi:hypothetical protein